MNLLSQLNDIITPNVTAIATIKGNKDNDVWVGETMGGGLVLLTSNETYQTGQKVYYNALTNQITGNAPNVEFRAFGV